MNESIVSSAGHQALMELAIVQAHRSAPVDSAYCVGCVIVASNSAEMKMTTILATGFSRELPGNTHAEESALMKLKDAGIATVGTDMYTTMEPCSKRLSGNEPCVKHIIEAQIGRVFIGAREPDHFVKCEGVDQLRAAGVEVYDVVYDGVRAACLKPNQHIAKFQCDC
jgi:pyrimidine deaminase RibD-like protein